MTRARSRDAAARRGRAAIDRQVARRHHQHQRAAVAGVQVLEARARSARAVARLRTHPSGGGHTMQRGQAHRPHRQPTGLLHEGTARTR